MQHFNFTVIHDFKGLNIYMLYIIKYLLSLFSYTGLHCETDINECASEPCHNGGKCQNLVNGFSCICPAGYYDDFCYSNINECASQPCKHGSCKDGVNTYTCTCEYGYEGRDCDHQINNCKNNPCQHGGACNTHLGYYTCTCAPGYTGKNSSFSVLPLIVISYDFQWHN